jgi:hypothetical protein
MAKYPRPRRNPHNSWFRCGWCDVAFRGSRAYLDHECPETPPQVKALRKDVSELTTKADNLNLPTDFGYKFIPPPEFWAKNQAPRAEK